MPHTDDFRRAFPGLKTQEPLAPRTTLGVGGPAEYFADVGTLQELTALRKIVEQHHLPVFFLGAGSNLLISDRGIPGLVIHLQGDFKKIEFHDQRVSVGVAAMMPTLARQAADRGLSGVEALIGVPGTIGGGLVMNAGTREGWLGRVVETVEVLTPSLQIEKIPGPACGFVYRHSQLEGQWLVSADLVLKSDDPASIMKRLESLLQHRTRTQPLTTSNCGSVFKNPQEGSAAQWIEKAGFKGMTEGRARVSEKHANFIVTESGAKAADVNRLIQTIQDGVLEKFNVRLEPEVKRVGSW